MDQWISRVWLRHLEILSHGTKIPYSFMVRICISFWVIFSFV